MDQFRSWLKHRDPDVAAYEGQKHLKMMSGCGTTEVTLSRFEIKDAVPPLPSQLLGNGSWLEQQWQQYYGPRLAAAALKNYCPAYTCAFPGYEVPGRGANMSTSYPGSLARMQLSKVWFLGGGMPMIGPLAKEREPREHQVGSALKPLEDLPESLQPPVRVLTVATADLGPISQAPMLMEWLEAEVTRFVNEPRVRVREIFTLVRSAWSPYLKPPVYAPETLRVAEILIDDFRKSHRRVCSDWLTFIFELEMTLSRLEYLWPLNVSGCGKYRWYWLEVGRLPIGKIQCTELAVTGRVLAELVNIRTKGFAPIVVNEYGCDTDGTHRIVASWLWNLLQRLPEIARLQRDVPGEARLAVTDDPSVRERLGTEIAHFVEEYAVAMGPIVIREAVRSLFEILSTPALADVFWAEVAPHLQQFHPVTHLPVVLLPEYSWGTVLKGPYDEGTASYRVDPTVYELLARDPGLTLPARGPYHLTDRTPLPWFEILEPR